MVLADSFHFSVSVVKKASRGARAWAEASGAPSNFLSVNLKKDFEVFLMKSEDFSTNYVFPNPIKGN